MASLLEINLRNILRQAYLPDKGTVVNDAPVLHDHACKSGCRGQIRPRIQLFQTLLNFALLLWLNSINPALATDIVRQEPPFAMHTQAIHAPYIPSLPATQRWKLCIVFPHIKDAYWLAVNYGMVQEAQRLGVELRFLEAGGYLNLQTQRALVKTCVSDHQTQALILGTVSFNGLSGLIVEAARRIPILATVNDINNKGIAAKVGVSWYDMGHLTGEYLVAHLPPGSGQVAIAWFPGPRGAGWVPFVDRGFRDAISGSPIVIAATRWGDTDKALQRNLVQDVLDEHPKVSYLVGNALMAEAAISVLRERKLLGKVQLISSYFTPAVYRGISRGRILAAPTDSPVLQGRLSVAQAVDLLEGRKPALHLGPAVEMVDQESLPSIKLEDSMPPPTFSPQFRFLPISTN